MRERSPRARAAHWHHAQSDEESSKEEGRSSVMFYSNIKLRKKLIRICLEYGGTTAWP